MIRKGLCAIFALSLTFGCTQGQPPEGATETTEAPPPELAPQKPPSKKVAPAPRVVDPATSQPSAGSGTSGRGPYTECSDPRPQMCTMDYNPVCGYSEETVACVKSPCPPIGRWKTYSNGCSACSNPDVLHWSEGECPPDR